MELNILDYLDKDSVVLELKPKSKKLMLSAILDHLVENKKIKKDSKKDILKALVQREEMGSTAIGGCIALPHSRIPAIKDIMLCLVISQEGVDFDSLDQEPVNIIVLLLSNQNEAGLHLKTLAFLARMLKDKYFVQRLKAAKSVKEALDMMSKQQQMSR